MRCENIFCIYWSKENICILDETELDINGTCTNCIYVDLDEYMLLHIRQRQLKNMDKDELTTKDKNKNTPRNL